MKYLILTLLLNIIAVSSISSQNFILSEGYIIQNNDTIYGEIKDFDWITTPSKVKFRVNSNNDFQDYAANEISGFYTTSSNKNYISFIISVNRSRHILEHLSMDKQPEMVIDTLFLELVISGASYNLYKHIDSDGRYHYFIQEENDTPTELIYHKYIKLINEEKENAAGNKVIKESTTYKGQLQFYFKDCNTLSSKINKTRYSEKALRGLFESYYNCKGIDLEIDKTAIKSTVFLKVDAGLALSKTNFVNESNYIYSLGFTENPIKVTASPQIGLSMKLNLPGKFDLIGVYLSTRYYYSNIDYNESFEFDGGFSSTTRNISLDLKNHFFDAAMGFEIYLLGKKKVNPFINFGIASHSVFNRNASFVDELDNSEIRPGIYNNGDYNKWVFAPEVGIGLKVKNFSIDARLLYNYKGYLQILALTDRDIHFFFTTGYSFQVNNKKKKKIEF